MNCTKCPRNCNVNRQTQLGFCKASNKLKVAHVSLHFGEEPCISGSQGSGTIFFCYCNLRCVFCQNAIIRDGKLGKEIPASHLAKIFKRLEDMGAHNINLVSPTQYAKQIVDALKIYRPKIPIVYNTNGYESESTLDLLSEYVDVFLVDLKYFDNKLSSALSSCPNYFYVASRAIMKMRQLIPTDKWDNNLLVRGVIVRHLVLPGHTNDSLRVINFLAENLPTTTLSLMSQFVPCDRAKEFGLDRTTKPIEYNKVLRYAMAKMKGEIFSQEASSATCELVPNWDPKTV